MQEMPDKGGAYKSTAFLEKSINACLKKGYEYVIMM